MTTPHTPETTRRRFIQAAAAGLGTAAVSGFAASCAGASEPQAAASGLADAVLEAFKTHRLVGLGEAHGLQSHGDALMLLLADPRLPEVADDIVVEFGNARYQHTIDAFINGQPVADAELRKVWRNTTQSPNETWDEPMYEQVYRTVRAANWALPAGKRMRVLLGDPPIDWSKVTTRREHLFWERQHGPMFWAPLVEKEVLAKGRRALLNFGADTFIGVNATVDGERIYRIVDVVPPAGDLGGLAGRLSRYPRYSVIPAPGTWLGSVDAGLVWDAPGPPGPDSGLRRARRGKGPIVSVGENFCGQRVGSLIDAALYLGQPGEVTASLPNPAIYLDPTYWKELRRRNALSSGGVKLDWWRQEHPQANVNWFRPPKCRRKAA
jgi:hypothetical protein